MKRSPLTNSTTASPTAARPSACRTASSTTATAATWKTAVRIRRATPTRSPAASCRPSPRCRPGRPRSQPKNNCHTARGGTGERRERGFAPLFFEIDAGGASVPASRYRVGSTTKRRLVSSLAPPVSTLTSRTDPSESVCRNRCRWTACRNWPGRRRDR